ncbi:MAG: glycosyltransferase family 4 protein [Phycisphaerales bacterium]
MRVCLFTDTLGDVNGVSRFIRNIAEQALTFGRSLHVITSTRFECPAQSNIVNIAPRYARAMPGYPQLELAIPPAGRLARLADSLAPDVVHVSTPGPVGALGRRFARRRGLPLLGTYHTDFPAYIDHLFADRTLTWVCDQSMRRFYRPFSRIFTRSADYAEALARLGIARERIVRLLPGIDTEVFHTRYRDPGVWSGFPEIPAGSVKALYVGRVSVEKNLPLLTRAWKLVASQWRASPPEMRPHLVIVGDGPYRQTMQSELAGLGAHFLGFRHGAELSTIYASADVFLFPSTTDTLGQVVMEAQSAGLAVCVTDQGGPKEVVNYEPGPEQSGFVLSAGNAAQWAQMINRIVEDGALRERLGAAGHRKIQPMSIRHSFEHFWRVHEEAASERAGVHAE